MRIKSRIADKIRKIYPGYKTYNMGQLRPERLSMLSSKLNIPSQTLGYIMMDFAFWYELNKENMTSFSDEYYSVLKDVRNGNQYVFELRDIGHILEIEALIDEAQNM